MGTQLAPTTQSIANRIERMFAIREATAASDAFVRAAEQYDNGDETLYTDKCGTYTKCIKQAAIGLVDLAAYKTFKKALNSGEQADFNNITVGGTRTLNDPQGGLAFDLQCRDSSQFLTPPAPALTSEEYATELVELYWASLLRDVAFTDYATNAIAIKAANELTMIPAYKGPRNGAGQVTPDLLFRGGYSGETEGPYLSQFLLKPTCIGALPITQQYTTFKAGVNYMLDPVSYQQVQNGMATGQSLQPLANPFYLHDGRGLGAYTHNDVLYEAYFIAFLVLQSLNGISCAVKDNPAPFNAGNPYNGDPTQNGFSTLGPPDIAATMAAVASEALKAVWYQKWYIHLRHRPEAGGALVYLAKTGQGNTVEGLPSNTVLNSQAVAEAFTKNNSYFLSQAFPEGSPAHPAYPTGHGTVAGACVTVLKFFYDGATAIPNPAIPKNDGTQLLNYMGPSLTVNGELNKLAHNISFGHGIHPGIHWRSDTDSSIELGEAVALSVLRDRIRTYNEKFSVQLTKVDGTIATISNE